MSELTGYTLPDRDEYAEGELRRILASEPGRLQIITAVHRCGCNERGTDPATPEEKAVCEAHAVGQDSPLHFVCLPVVALSERDERGKITASAEDGSWAVGQPAALLNRLLQAVNAAVAASAAERV